MDAILVVRGKDVSKSEFHREIQSSYHQFPIGKLFLSSLGNDAVCYRAVSDWRDSVNWNIIIFKGKGNQLRLN